MEQQLYSSAVFHLFYQIKIHLKVRSNFYRDSLKNCFVLGDWKYHPILTWNELSKAFPWGVFMLQGAGLAIADGFKVYL
jgi:di/tricarboxylate transporter